MTCVIAATSRGGTLLNPAGGEYTSEIVGDQLALYLAGRSVAAAQRAGRGAAYGGATWEAFEFNVHHAITSAGAYYDATYIANLLKLQREHYRPDLDASTLVVTYNSIAMRITVGPPRLEPLADAARGVVVGIWTVLDMVRVADSAGSTAAAAKTSSPATVSVANAGSAPITQATVTVKPTVAKTAANGQRHVRYITPIWRVPRSEVRPCDLTNAVAGDGWDHATEVTATRSQADGDDVELYANGRRVPRWTWASGTGSWNQTATRLWANLAFPAARYWTLTAAAGTGATTLNVLEDLDAMPATPFNVAFDDTGYDVARVTAYSRAAGTLTVVRDVRGTTATASHAANVKAYYCPVLLDLAYGGTSLATPTQDDGYKPMVLEGTPPTPLSDNGYWHYQSFQETTAAADTQARKPRGGTWRTESRGDHARERKTGQGDQYWRWIPRTATLSTDAPVASAMCLAYRSAGAIAGHPLADRWALRSAVGITQVVHTRVTTTIAYGTEARLSVEGIDADGNVEVLETSAATGSTSPTLTPTSSIYAVVFRIEPFDPKTDASANVVAGEPTDADGWTEDDVKLTFSTSEEPLFVWGTSPGATANLYQFGRPGAGATLADSDGNTITLDGILCRINDTLILDLDAMTAVMDDGLSVAHMITGVWPAPAPGTANLTWTETGLSGGASIDIGVSSFRSTWT